MKIKISVNPSLNGFKKSLEGLRKRMIDMSDAYEDSAIYLDTWVQRNFKTEGGKVGGWKALKLGGRWIPKDGKRVFDKSAKILMDTTNLSKSHVSFWSNKNAGIGADAPYAKAHHEGIGVPQRRTLPKRSEVDDDIKKIFDRHVKRAMKYD